jgi:hypothetical protein
VQFEGRFASGNTSVLLKFRYVEIFTNFITCPFTFSEDNQKGMGKYKFST